MTESDPPDDDPLAIPLPAALAFVAGLLPPAYLGHTIAGLALGGLAGAIVYATTARPLATARTLERVAAVLRRRADADDAPPEGTLAEHLRGGDDG